MKLQLNMMALPCAALPTVQRSQMSCRAYVCRLGMLVELELTTNLMKRLLNQAVPDNIVGVRPGRASSDS